MENHLPEIREEYGNEFGTADTNGFGCDGGKVTLPAQQEASDGEKALGDVDPGWVLVVAGGGWAGEEVSLGDFEDVDEEGRLRLMGGEGGSKC